MNVDVRIGPFVTSARGAVPYVQGGGAAPRLSRSVVRVSCGPLIPGRPQL